MTIEMYRQIFNLQINIDQKSNDSFRSKCTDNVIEKHKNENDSTDNVTHNTTIVSSTCHNVGQMTSTST